jgi:hypothetical protein
LPERSGAGTSEHNYPRSADVLRFVAPPYIFDVRINTENTCANLGVSLAVCIAAASACTFKESPTEVAFAGSGTGGATLHTGAGGSKATGHGGSSATGAGGAGGAPGPCTNLECRQNTCVRGNCMAGPCAPGKRTTVSGTVYDPAGKVPLYNVIVYVPNAPLDPVTEGVSCDRCGSTVSGSPVSTTITDEKGQFVLKDAPVGASIPLVIQIGKWRRELTIPNVAACTDTPLTDKDMTRLPRNQSEGHIPKIALTTGSADALECLLRKIGIQDSEFTPETGTGRVNLFTGAGGTKMYSSSLNGGAAITPVEPWWDSLGNLEKYDLLLHSCEGNENSTNKSVTARQAFLDYTSAGGRAFLSHWHNYWVEHGPSPLPTVANFDHQLDPPDPLTALLDTSFPKGAALATWLVNVGGSTTRGQLVIRAGQHTIDSVNANAQRWIYSDAMPSAPQVTLHNPSVQYLTFNTPLDVAADQECGRVVLSDIHVSNAGNPPDVSGSAYPFPTGCKATDLSPQEKALEFMLFDLSSCIQRDVETPTVPIVP